MELRRVVFRSVFGEPLEDHTIELVALELDRVIFKGLREYEVSRKLAIETGLPECLQEFRGGPGPHLLDDRGQRERSRVRETIEDRAQPEPVIPVTLRALHSGQVLPLRIDPVDD